MSGAAGSVAAGPGPAPGIRFHDPLYYWATRFPDLCYADGPRTITYRQAVALTEWWMRLLHEAGLRPSDRVALVSDNDPLAPLVICTTSLMGAVTVPLNPRLTASELGELIAESGTKAVVAGPRHAALLSAAGSLPAAAARYCFGADLDGWDRLPEQVSPEPGDGRRTAGRGLRESLAIQPFTSGTTGTPKSALIRHESFVVESVRWQAAGMRLDVGERLYLPLPLTLAAGICLAFHALWNGATLVTEPFDAATAARRLVAGDVEAMVLVPTMIHMVLDQLGERETASPGLRWLFYGAAPMSAPLLSRALRRLGCELYQGYGATEAMALTLLTPQDHERAAAGAEHLLRSVGRPQLGCPVRVLSDDGADAAPGAVGEICTLGQQVFTGYADPAQTARAFDDTGWYHTGDLGYFDDEGYLYITDRKDNMIISGGINVSPTEVEALIRTLDAVEDVAVVGLPDEKWGQQVVAAVKRKPSATVSENEVLGACADKLAPFKRPRLVFFLDELPYNANGKLQHSRVRERLAAARPHGMARG